MILQDICFQAFKHPLVYCVKVIPITGEILYRGLFSSRFIIALLRCQTASTRPEFAEKQLYLKSDNQKDLDLTAENKGKCDKSLTGVKFPCINIAFTFGKISLISFCDNFVKKKKRKTVYCCNLPQPYFVILMQTNVFIIKIYLSAKMNVFRNTKIRIRSLNAFNSNTFLILFLC